MSARPRPLPVLALLALAIIFASGCGGSAGGDYGGAHPDYAKALAGSPAPLAALHKQGDELLEGGEEAFEKRIKALHGYPVVANIWASWCGPCRGEFPILQQFSAHRGKKVAVLGVNSEDSNDAAATFLREAPVPYPSYTDPDGHIHDSVNGRGLPNTAFYNRNGEFVYLKYGPYRDEAELEEDLRRYALQGG